MVRQPAMLVASSIRQDELEVYEASLEEESEASLGQEESLKKSVAWQDMSG